MLRFVSQLDPFFDRKTAQELFLIHVDDLEDQYGFDFLLKHSLFWNIYDQNNFVGCIFCFEEDHKNWVGGFAHRKNHFSCVRALQQIRLLFPVLYAHTIHLNAVICLKRAGFEWFDREKGILVAGLTKKGESE